MSTKKNKPWIGTLAKLAVVATGLLIGSAAAVIGYWNRSVPEPTLAEKQRSYQRAVDWIRANEARVLNDSNSALWWMVKATAERTGDAYLASLVDRWVAVVDEHGYATSPWKRILDPKADVTLNNFSMAPYEPYQRFLLHAVTCQSVSLDNGGDTSEFLNPGVCRPIATQVYARDPACTTHQLMGVRLLQRAGCQTGVDLPRLESALLADIEEQMRWDVLFKDAYIQRVLMLQWAGSPGQVKPIWLHRVLGAQQPDGGWVSGRHMPELPDWIQPWRLRAQAAPTNFHATAQGLLLTALAITEKPR